MGKQAAWKPSHGTGGTTAIYIDFPKTMKGLRKVVDYIIPATDPAARDELEKKLVRRFNEIVEAEVGKTDFVFIPSCQNYQDRAAGCFS